MSTFIDIRCHVSGLGFCSGLDIAGDHVHRVPLAHFRRPLSPFLLTIEWKSFFFISIPSNNIVISGHRTLIFCQYSRNSTIELFFRSTCPFFLSFLSTHGQEITVPSYVGLCRCQQMGYVSITAWQPAGIPEILSSSTIAEAKQASGNLKMLEL